MRELLQAGNFYRALDGKEKDDLIEAVAADIFFLEGELQQRLMEIFRKIDSDMAERIEETNRFTT